MKSDIKKIFILSTAMLSFISFWRASAIVLCDFGSSAYYAGGIAAKAFGPAFPYFILAVMLFAGLMLMVYIESSSIFTRGGVYVVVRETMGKTMAKFSVSALIFDYLLTGPISSVSAGLYVAALFNIVLPAVNPSFHINERLLAVVFSLFVIFYFWRENIKGVKESSDNNVRIIFFVAFTAVILFIWSGYTLFQRGFELPPFRLEFSKEALGWTEKIDWLKPVGIFGIIMAFGHSILALSGLETLAQVYREIEDPKIKNLKKTVIVVFLFSLFFTGLLTFMSSLIIPYEKIISSYSDNLLSGLAMEMAGPYSARVALKVLVVISAVLILIGAVNTSFVGSNSILNRVAEDGILNDWFRALHGKYGTTYRMITIVALLQALIVILSGGDIFLLGEAYAFGVLWSLSFNVASIIVLRFKKSENNEEWIFPFNISWDKYKIPVGLFLVFTVLISVSLTNLLTKKIATISGILFTLILYFLFTYSEKKSEKKTKLIDEEKGFEEKLNLKGEEDISKIALGFSKQNKILLPVRNPNNLFHLKSVLEKVDDSITDIVILYVKVQKGLESSGETSAIGEDDKEIFKQIILMAEKYGKTVTPVILYSNDPFYTIVSFALALKADEIVMGVSGSVGAEVQLEKIAVFWGMLKPADYQKQIKVKVVWESRTLTYELS
ncbi:MAG: APC family permease [Elusimicrobiota bacterium]